MRLSEILGLIRNEVPFDEENYESLKSLLEEYPYFQAAHLLYLLNLFQIRDTRFNSELKKTAIYLSDRKQLFFLIENKFFSPEMIRKIEREQDFSEPSAFEMIDVFLKEEAPRKQEKPLTTGGKLDKIAYVSTDYVSVLLSEDSKEKQDPIIPMQHQDKIDEFISKNEESPVKINLIQNPEDEIPSETNEEDMKTSEFFSETLAKIYIKQHKYDKALEIIRKLSLVYPEKNRYFADQIRFLEKLIINT